MPRPLRSLASRLTRSPSGPAVYFLVLDQVVVYIGKSFTPTSRVASHMRAGRIDFDDVLFLPETRADLADAERGLIALFYPQHNKQIMRFDHEWLFRTRASMGIGDRAALAVLKFPLACTKEAASRILGVSIERLEGLGSHVLMTSLIRTADCYPRSELLRLLEDPQWRRRLE